MVSSTGAEGGRLHRFVALKLLSDRIANDPVARDRFPREAEAASALNHPGIGTICDVGEADDFNVAATGKTQGVARNPRLVALVAGGRLPTQSLQRLPISPQ